MTITKALSGVEVKNADAGTVRATFATLNVVDRDGDVTVPGAFTNGQKVRISAFNHGSWDGALPVGKGTIIEVGDEAVFEGQFFLSTSGGRDTFETVKLLDDLGEWSYSLHDVVAEQGEFEGKRVRFLKSIRVHEVSPVLQGAGIGTRTLGVKSASRLSEHLASVVADVDELAERVADVVAKRAEKGKTIGEESSDLLALLAGDLDRASAAIKALVSPDPQHDDHMAAALELLRLVATQHGVTS